MLVLSRKESDKIVFPTVGITVEVLRIQGNTTRLGIDAPSDIPIYRHEIADLKAIDFNNEQEAKQRLRELARAMRRRLDSAAVALNCLHRHFEEEGDATAQQFVLDVFRELRELDREADGALESDDKCVARALLVEDDDNERGLLASYLQMRGIETTTASDGQDALDFLSLHARPDVVLLDIQMPRCDGRRLVDRIRANARYAGVKLIAVSGTDPGSVGIPTGPGGIDRWFAKPIDPESLIDGIAQELGVDSTAG